MRLGLDGAILVYQPGAKRRQRSTATMRSAGLGADHRLTKAGVHVVYQEPRPTIGHAERDAGLGDRSSIADRLQQPDLAGTDRPILAEIYSKGEPRPRHLVDPIVPPRTAMPIETGNLSVRQIPHGSRGKGLYESHAVATVGALSPAIAAESAMAEECAAAPIAISSPRASSPSRKSHQRSPSGSPFRRATPL